jgi:N utilization substance protein A
MAKNKTNKKRTKPNRLSAGKKAKPMKKMVKKKLAKKSGNPKKKLAKKKKPALKKAAVKTKALGKKTTGARTLTALSARVRGENQSVDTEAFAPEALRERSGGQSGDFQGLSNIEGANSESVAELIEEGNAFEADAVAGVEHAGDNDQREVRTHEVPEDDVPGEYLDKE